MNGVIGVFNVELVGITFLIFVLLISLVYYAARRRTGTARHVPGKRKPYMCGEEARGEATMPHMGFYKTVMAGMKFRMFRRLQSGNLSDYILAVLVGIIVLFLLLVMLW